jgi:protein-S-isoprenylcysteine O-methyltransferase Ste14
MQLGMLVFLWSQPVMTGGQLMLAAGMTGYMLVGLLFEERDLVRRFGDDYRSYQRQVPMLIPGWRS